MREIKFRAWHKEEKRYLPIMEIDAFDCYVRTYDDKYLSFEINLEQYTGLHDKNGKEIYEGDIVELKVSKFSGEGKLEGVITPLVVSYSDYSEWLIGNIVLSRVFERTSVIGNIHENKELLDGGNDKN